MYFVVSKRLFSSTFVLFLFIVCIFFPNPAKAGPGGECGTNADCGVPPGNCTYACVNNSNNHQLGSSIGEGTCKESCSGSSCGNWSGWSTCVNGCQHQSCQDGVHNGYQQQSCGGGSCGGGGGNDNEVPPGANDACTVNLTTPASIIEPPSNFTLTATVNATSGTVQWVHFSSSNQSIVTVITPDSATPFTSTGTALIDGTSTVTAQVIMTGNVVCSDTLLVTVAPPGPWWQVQDADVSAGGDLVSPLPNDLPFDEDGLGGFPGIPHYSGLVADFSYNGSTNGNVSTAGWLVNSSTNLSKLYDYSFFERSIPDDTVVQEITTNSIPGTTFTTGGTLSHGYYWYKYDGSSTGLDLTISSDANITNRKVILLVDSADLIIDGKINLTDGQGFFMAVVGKTSTLTKGNIRIGTGVGGASTPHLEGIYMADNTVYTGAGTSRLYIRGSVVGYDGILLQRDLGSPANDTIPAEYFEYAPDQIMLYPSKLGARKINWKEVAP